MSHRATPPGLASRQRAATWVRECRRWNTGHLRHAILGLLCALSVLGCGAHGRRSPTRASVSSTSTTSTVAVPQPVIAICAARVRAIVARYARVPEGRVDGVPGRNGDDAPQCRFAAGSLRLTAASDGSPQPYAVLERAVDEEAQMFTMKGRATKPPQAVKHLGLDAYWFPQEKHLMTTDGLRLITVTVLRWPHVPQGRWNALAAAVARPYLGRLRRDLVATEQ